MGKTSNRVKDYKSARGAMHKMSLSDIYYKTVELRTVLLDISRNHKKWGKEWYTFIEVSMFEEAIMALIVHGKGEMLATTISKVNELADLEAHMMALERRER